MKTINQSQKISNRIQNSKIKLLIVLSICITLLLSCSQYQYVSLDSNLYKNENKEFFVDNDTVAIKYAFSGENFLIAISIYNKLQIPLYIDWAKTNIIINGGQINHSFYHEEQFSYIAPQSFTTILSNTLLDQFININLHDSLSNVGIIKGENGNWVRLSFNEKRTPILFRSILTLTMREDSMTPIYLDNAFWVSEILQTRGDSSIKNLPSNQFYIQKPTAFGKIMGWSAGIASLIILGISNSEDE